MADLVFWKNLPYDITRKISESFLATDDIDHYVAFRAVCGNWRRATDSTADATDPRFMPSKWIMLEHSIHDNDRVTFFNLSTGRRLRKKIPTEVRNRRYFFVGVTKGGLFVLGQRAQPYQTRVLNPFTGAMARFKVHIPMEQVSSVVVTTSPMMVFISNLLNDCVSWADQTSEEWHTAFGFGEGECRTGDWGFGDGHKNLTSFAGSMYITNKYGSIISTITDVYKEGNQWKRSAGTISMFTTIVGPNFELAHGSNNFYLVESEGELLLVMDGRICNGMPVVYKVDTVNKVLVPVRSIGSRALFVSSRRCLSIDTTKSNKFHSIESGTIYYADRSVVRAYDQGSLAGSGWEEEPKYVFESATNPFSKMAELLVNYCTTIEYSELQMLPPYGEEGYTYYEYGDPSD
ncbi:hypothetical protein VPH35_056194 [Triticum aestivum]|uniref:KIB1-4 beta-propeller domain-containing protein n=1 Tax=Triticum aestivum TaxID=4565 RepID=A0A3B6G1U4_WHEAT